MSTGGTKVTFKILAINPGSTSTKIAIYDDINEVSSKCIEHSREEIERYEKITDQYEMRYGKIMDFLRENNFDIKELSAVVGRGGPLPPVRAGAYRINNVMMDRLKNRPLIEHVSSLGAIIAKEIADSIGVDAYIYDSISVDELDDIAKVSGLADIKRRSLTHCLNMRAAAIKVAEGMGRKYDECNFVVIHIGGGTSLTAHKKGRMVDVVADAEASFSPERSGGLPSDQLVELCYSNDKSTIDRKLRGKGGLVSYLNTNSALEVEDRIKRGDRYAALIYEAMAYQAAKAIGELSVALEGEVDRIIVTGGIACSKMIIDWIKQRVAFIAPVEVVPGENELQALALGVLRVLKGEEKAYEYDLD